MLVLTLLVSQQCADVPALGPAAITRVDPDVVAQSGRAMAFVVKTFETL
jgi:hypothetical protein